MTTPAPTASGTASASETATASGAAASSSGPPPTTPDESALLGAAQDALAAELQAAWGYPVLGPRLTDPTQVGLARAADDAHTTAVDALRATLAALDRTPVTPAASYPLPTALTTAAEAVTYAASLEATCAAAWRFVVVRASGGTDVAGLRATAVDALAAAAVREARWQAVATPDAPTSAFPGT